MKLEALAGLELRETVGGVRFGVRVQPRSSTNEIIGVHAGALKVKLTAPPVDGAANEALVDLLAKKLDVAKKRISIVSGSTSKSKTVEIASA